MNIISTHPILLLSLFIVLHHYVVCGVVRVESASSSPSSSSGGGDSASHAHQRTHERPLYNSAEHRTATTEQQYITLVNATHTYNVSAVDYLFVNSRGITTYTYGDLVALSGDFYGATSMHDVICYSSQPVTSFKNIFEDFWNTSTSKYIDFYNNQFNIEYSNAMSALNNNRDVANAYADLDETQYFLDIQVIDRGFTLYSTLNVNYDHFSENNCSFLTYSVGHNLAMQYAVYSGDIMEQAKNNHNDAQQIQQAILLLIKAYAMNAFADHFLSDSFASGHLRVPRKKLVDYCSGQGRDGGPSANKQHNEDNRNGVKVRNKRGDVFWTYGDGAYWHSANHPSRAIQIQCMQMSKNQVYYAYLYRNITHVQTYTDSPLDLVPIPSSWRDYPLDNTIPMYDVLNDALYIREPLSRIRHEMGYNYTQAPVRDNFQYYDGPLTYIQYSSSVCPNCSFSSSVNSSLFRAVTREDCVSTFFFALSKLNLPSFAEPLTYQPQLKGYVALPAEIHSMFDVYYYWKTSDWSSCSKSCGLGKMTRSIQCYKAIPLFPDVGPYDDSVCEHLLRPSSQTVCNPSPCLQALSVYFHPYWQNRVCQSSTTCISSTISTSLLSPVFEERHYLIDFQPGSTAYTFQIGGMKNKYYIIYNWNRPASYAPFDSIQYYSAPVDDDDDPVQSLTFVTCSTAYSQRVYIRVGVHENRVFQYDIDTGIQLESTTTTTSLCANKNNKLVTSNNNNVFITAPINSPTNSSLVETQSPVIARDSLVITLKLSMDMSSYSNNTLMTSFHRDFITTFNLTSTRVRILSVLPGSIIVRMEIQAFNTTNASAAASSSAEELSPSQVLDALQLELKHNNGMLLSSAIGQHIQSDSLYVEQYPNQSSSNNDVMWIIIGVILGFIFVVILLFLIRSLCKRSVNNKSDNQSSTSANSNMKSATVHPDTMINVTNDQANAK